MKMPNLDQEILFSLGPFNINYTIFYTWIVMLILFILGLVLNRKQTSNRTIIPDNYQGFLEVLIEQIQDQLNKTGIYPVDQYLVFIGTVFLYILFCVWLSIIPGFESPTTSLSTTTALALCVFLAVPYYNIKNNGFIHFLKSYAKPTFLLIPFNIIGQFSSTFALAVRLFGNSLSGTMILLILLATIPLFFPVLMSVMELLTGTIQAYIFAILSSVYLSATIKTRREL